MQLCTLVLAVLAIDGSCTSLRKNRLDVNQAVYIENAPVLGAGAGEGALGECSAFADAHAVKVCGTGIKATFFLRGRCAEYYEHSKVVGKCDTGMSSDTCDEWSPLDDPKFGHYQSYLIEAC